MALKITNEYYDLIDDALRTPEMDVTVRVLGVVRAHLQLCHAELRELRRAQSNHDRQLAERDAVIAALRGEASA